MNKLKLPVQETRTRGGCCPGSNAFVYAAQSHRRSGRCVVRYFRPKRRGALSANRKDRSKLAWRGVKGSALGVLLVASALLTAVAVGSADCSWFVWFGLLPLFLAIRLLSPAVAALAGALWSGCLCLFLVAGAVPGLSLTAHSFALSAIVLMLYAYFAVLLTRWIGFSPMLLALGWILVELTLKPLGLRQGLLAGTQSAAGFLHLISCLLGYVFVAFLVASANAWLVFLLSSVRLRIPCWSSFGWLADCEACHLSQTSLCLRVVTIFRAYPRAPPWS